MKISSPVLVVLGEEAVAGDDVVEQAEAERAAQQPVGRVAAGAHAADVVDELVHATGHRGVALHRARDLLDVRDRSGCPACSRSRRSTPPGASSLDAGRPRPAA